MASLFSVYSGLSCFPEHAFCSSEKFRVGSAASPSLWTSGFGLLFVSSFADFFYGIKKLPCTRCKGALNLLTRVSPYLETY